MLIAPDAIFAEKVASKSSQFQWMANTIVVGLASWATIGGEINGQDLNFEDKIWLDFICTRLMSFKNDQRVPIEVVILIVCLMSNI